VEGDVFFEETIELSRRTRALKLWLSLRHHGLDAFRHPIAQNLRLAHLLADLVDQERRLERVAVVPLSAVCFRWADGDPASLDEKNASILDRVNRRVGPTCPTPRCAANSCSAHASPTTARQTPTWSP
jgi:aromatic-L-amino-acid decarboxylase